MRRAELAALADWITPWEDHLRRLLRPINKGGRIVCAGLTPKSVYQVLAKRAKESGLSEALTPHDLRRSLAGYLLTHYQPGQSIDDAAAHGAWGEVADEDANGG